MKTKYYAFALNEYRYKRISFSVHRTLKAAERAAFKFAGPYKGNAYSDLEQYVLTDIEAWADEYSYSIDWDNRILIARN
jgi:hypothetical protein